MLHVGLLVPNHLPLGWVQSGQQAGLSPIEVPPVSLLRLASLAALIAAFALTPGRAHAQDPDIIRGRITGPDSLPIQNATITATAISSNISKVARTDKNGNFSIPFGNAEGDYWVNVAAVGFTARRFEVKRLGDEDILVADARLAKGLTLLPPVQSIGKRPVVSRTDVSDISGAEKSLLAGAVDFTQLGDLSAMAATIPGINLLPSADGSAAGFSVNGLDASQNTFLLNGLSVDGSGLPRDAGLITTYNTTPFGAPGGGNGAQVSSRGAAGTNFIQRQSSVAGLTPSMQFVDQSARALGTQKTYGSVGGKMSGPFKLNTAYYSLSGQFDNTTTPLTTLLNANSAAFATAGLARDSITELAAAMSNLGLPFTVPLFPAQNENRRGLVFGQIDVSPPNASAQSLQMTVSGNWAQTNPQNLGPSGLLSVPANGSHSDSWSGTVGGRHQMYVHGAFLSTTNVGFSASHSSTDPYLSLPNGRIQLASDLDDGVHLNYINVGGNSSIATGSATTSAQISNGLRWSSMSNKHSFTLASNIQRNTTHQDPTGNLLGSFTFNSLADFEGGQPSLFTRTLTGQAQSTSQLLGGVGFSDQWRPDPSMTINFTLRADASGFGLHPASNPDVQRVFGIANDNVPHPFALSPSFRFSKLIGEAQQITAIAGQVRGPQWRISGGGGFLGSSFNTLAGVVNNAVRSTGLPSGIQTLSCVGSAAPLANWTSFLNNPSNIPTECADGTTGTVYASTAPNVNLVDRNYQAQRSLGLNVNLAGPVLNNRFLTNWAVTALNTSHQPGYVDLNFDPTTRFTLPDEGGRPVFVQPTSIVPTTGQVAVGDGRISSEFNRVLEYNSNLHAESRNFILSARPLSVNTLYSWSTSYTFQWNRNELYGFSSTVGNPLDKSWTLTTNNPVHQFRLSLGYNIINVAQFTWSLSLSSGMPITPRVSGDINGDGVSGNDRPFIFDPAKTADLTLAAAMNRLLQTGSPIAKSCLSSQLGKLAGLGSCQGPWWFSTNPLQVSINPLRLHLPQRARLRLSVSNPLGAADLLVHGSSNIHGWGQRPTPDQTLYYVRGFDPSTDRYIYEVNPRFGSTVPNQSLGRIVSPVTLNAIFYVDLGPTRERQSLTQMLDRGRSQDGLKATEATIKSSFGNNIVINPMARILQQADLLGLNGSESVKTLDSLSYLNRWFITRLDSIWTPVSKALADMPPDYDQGEAYSLYKGARIASFELLIKIAPDVQGLLTNDQKRKLGTTALYLDKKYLRSIEASTAGSTLPGG